MFGWLKCKSKASPASYRVWVTEAAKFNGIEKSLRASVDAGSVVVFVVHFDETASVLGTVLDELRIAWSAVTHGSPAASIVSAIGGGSRVVIVRGEQLPATEPAQATDRDAERVTMIAVELHPTDNISGRCAALAAALPFETAVEHHTSLEDPVLRVFVDDGTAAMLRKLGLTEDEPIEHAMVDRSVARAQAKIASHVKGLRGPQPTAARWLEVHCPGLATPGRD